MAPYYVIRPEAAGDTEFPASVQTVPDTVREVRISIQVWLGDDLIEAYPCYFATRSLRQAILNSELTGAGWGEAKVSEGDMWRQMRPGQPLPELVWMKVLGRAAADDFGIGRLPAVFLGRAVEGPELVVSARALALLKRFKLDQCRIEECALD